MKYHHVKVKVFTPEKDSVMELLVMAETFTDCEAITTSYVEQLANEFKVTDIKDAKVSRVIDDGEHDKYVMLTASWLSVEDKVVKENIAIMADTVQEAISLFDKQSEGMINTPTVECVKTTKINDRIDDETQTELFKSFEVNK